MEKNRVVVFLMLLVACVGLVFATHDNTKTKDVCGVREASLTSIKLAMRNDKSTPTPTVVTPVNEVVVSTEIYNLVPDNISDCSINYAYEYALDNEFNNVSIYEVCYDEEYNSYSVHMIFDDTLYQCISIEENNHVILLYDSYISSFTF